jgi:hypothetical protein
VTEVGLRPLRLDRLSDARVVNNPYPHVVVENALDHLDPLNADFPPREAVDPVWVFSWARPFGCENPRL